MQNYDSLKIDFGAIIHNKRKQLHYTLQGIANYCGVSVNFISLVERGVKTPRDETVIKIASILELDEYELFKVLDKIHPEVKLNISKAINHHTGLRELFGELSRKVKDDNMQEQLYEEVYNVYLDFLKRNNLD